MKIGIYTIHSAYNYGAMFQAYATQKALEKLGYDSEFVNLYTKEAEAKNENKLNSYQLKPLLISLYSRLNPKVRLKYKRFREFHSKMILSKRYYSLDEIYKTPPKYDAHLVGSDQVWNLQQGFSERAYYFLDFLNNNEIKISYAASFGTSQVNKKYHDQLKTLLTSFKSIAVREDDGVNIIKEATGLGATQVLDPTYLLNADEWSDLAPERLIKENYIFCYGFDDSEISSQLINNTKKRLNLPVIALSIGVSFPHKVDRFFQEAGPREFISLIKHASFICTSSYHGLAFAIHFRKSFFTVKHPQRNSRMETIMNKFNLFDRQISRAEDILELTEDQLFIDYTTIEEKINFQTTQSLKCLKDSVANISGE
ncbi:polysaccharide pyruvyl transferase family protein [Algibacter lectus]|uniref:polysaccharide pyruvyl transferase family protein n=1 Tax=Algibacter lectus TaxID=221126 RepID=UPI0026EF5A97|nr:polysaccharide pyruvyl transferase family protein [Algibacter lectus]MDO7138869.1 polysaccharide pyruvyl transferase family protein [Algibacter lectus]